MTSRRVKVLGLSPSDGLTGGQQWIWKCSYQLMCGAGWGRQVGGDAGCCRDAGCSEDMGCGMLWDAALGEKFE